ncbi:uncharacterized protein I303_101451 [Kwoniella dejecticola CBS 10117]|uniref:Zn(2)-C6 fungal-type domain-containing protein n=1 Tax=Kwoniella dejecticola CBS 10117 TaxID=1296121 RepID=A0A1A6AHV7_9TREE|nr:uncharacterized protein I303_01460 [Kwoniella dejecticola CBS 10117]OBR89631.1 hypothetical protein I303_01460 [Kwoniella dejecticola CBS 10117]
MGPSAPPAPDRRPLAKGSACEGCKLRKVRCGAEKPTCLNCARHGKKCDYPEPKSGRNARPSDAGGSGVSQDVLLPSVQSTIPTLNLDQPVAPLTSSQPHRMQPSSAHVPHIQSFHPSSGTEGDQPLPDLDFSWLLDIPDMAVGLGDGQQQDLPELDAAAREHSNQTASGLEMNIARFYERLSSADQSSQVHPSLLSAMFLTICRASPIEAVRRREDTFFKETEAGIFDSLKNPASLVSHLLDLTRAATLLSEWLWTEAREAEAVVMTSVACRFADAACLDQLHPDLIMEKPDKVRLRRQRRPLDGNWPRDHVELADSIYAFWSVILLDFTAGVAASMPAHFSARKIRTPLPRAWSTYVDQPSPQPDRYIHELFLEYPIPTGGPIQCDFAYLIQAIVLLHSACQRLYEESLEAPAPSGPRSSPFNLSHTSPHSHSHASPHGLSHSSPASTKRDTHLLSTIERFAAQIPPHLKSMYTELEGIKVMSPAAMTLHFVLCGARMYTMDTNSFETSNDAAIYQARRMVDIIRMMGPVDLNMMSISIYLLWCLATHLLLREIKRLTIQGDTISVVPLEADVDFVIHTLTVLSIRSPLLHLEVQALLEAKQLSVNEIAPSTASTINRDDQTPASQGPSTGQTTDTANTFGE